MKKVNNYKTVPVEKLRWKCDSDCIKSGLSEVTTVCPDVIGQKRGVEALRLGFDIESKGYNIFVNGLPGTGRKTAIRCLLGETQRISRIPDDKLYVNNFKNVDMPILIRLKAGEGRKFKKDMGQLVEFLETSLPGLFDNEEYKNKKNEIVDLYKRRQNKLVKDFEEKASKENFALIQMQVGAMVQPGILPVFEGKPINFNQLVELVKQEKISDKEADKIKKKHAELLEQMEVVLKEIRDIEKEMVEDLKQFDNEMVTPNIELRIKEIKNRYKSKKIDSYLEDVKESILENVGRFIKPEKSKAPFDFKDHGGQDDPFIEYSVNLLVDNCGAEQAPVIFETSPTYSNLFGTVEVTPGKGGFSKTDFTKIKAGSILKADGGFLIVEALDLLIEPGVWQTLKRTLKNRKLEIQIYAPVYMISISGMKPEPIDCDVKVAIIGDPYIYHLLYNQDQEFKKIFKLRADFDSVMDISQQSIADYINFIARIVESEELLTLNMEATGAVIEYGVRLAGKQSKLSTQFNHVADILREANYWARKEGKRKITGDYIKKAIESKDDRSGLIEEKIQEMIEEGTIMIDTEGETIGQVNGLSVYDMGDYSFGKPSRITANVSLGDSGIINIEREAQLSGRIHNKGVLILSGFLNYLFAQNKPLSINASLCFEQSYSGVEGDSASSTEIYALLSSLSGQPLKQNIAVTGSVNQKGEIQPIGGVNQKIEGFYKVCQAKGLTGTQGVMIPHQNVSDLMLHQDVVDAVKNGTFVIYPVETIDQGIEILTGLPAGEPMEDGKFESGSVYDLVDKKLQFYADQWKKYKMG
jgi:ATP-dependent Lon protease